MLANGISFNLYMFPRRLDVRATWPVLITRAHRAINRTPPIMTTRRRPRRGGPCDAPKYPALRDVIRKHFPTKMPFQDVKDDSNIIAKDASLTSTRSAGLARCGQRYSEKSRFSENVKTDGRPRSESRLCVLSTSRFVADANGTLEFKEQRRLFASILCRPKLVGKLDRRLKERSMKIDAKKGDVLQVLVENAGRINSGKEFIFDRKG